MIRLVASAYQEGDQRSQGRDVIATYAFSASSSKALPEILFPPKVVSERLKSISCHGLIAVSSPAVSVNVLCLQSDCCNS